MSPLRSTAPLPHHLTGPYALPCPLQQEPSSPVTHNPLRGRPERKLSRGVSGGSSVSDQSANPLSPERRASLISGGRHHHQGHHHENKRVKWSGRLTRPVESNAAPGAGASTSSKNGSSGTNSARVSQAPHAHREDISLIYGSGAENTQAVRRKRPRPRPPPPQVRGRESANKNI